MKKFFNSIKNMFFSSKLNSIINCRSVLGYHDKRKFTDEVLKDNEINFTFLIGNKFDSAHRYGYTRRNIICFSDLKYENLNSVECFPYEEPRNSPFIGCAFNLAQMIELKSCIEKIIQRHKVND